MGSACLGAPIAAFHFSTRKFSERCLETPSQAKPSRAAWLGLAWLGDIDAHPGLNGSPSTACTRDVQRAPSASGERITLGSSVAAAKGAVKQLGPVVHTPAPRFCECGTV